MARLRVALDASPLLAPRAGIGRYVEQLLGALLARQEADIRLMASWRPGPSRSLSELQSFYGPLGADVRSNPIPNRVLHLSWELLSAPDAQWLAGPCDVFHGANYLVPPARRAGAVATVHDLTALRFPEWHTPYQRAMARYLPKSIARSDLLLADSHATARDLMEQLSVPEQKVRVVPLAAAPSFSRPVEKEEASAVRSRYGLTGGYVLFVGTLEPRKNLPTLLKAHGMLPKAMREAFPLILAGGEGWGEKALHQAIAAAPHVRRLGRVPDEHLPALMAEASCFVYPSLYEGFGLPVLEAMAAGAPVITSDTSSLPEVAGDAALLVSPLDAEQLADAMARLVEDDSLATALRKRGRAQAAAFSWEKTAELTLSAYREVAANKP